MKPFHRAVAHIKRNAGFSRVRESGNRPEDVMKKISKIEKKD